MVNVPQESLEKPIDVAWRLLRVQFEEKVFYSVDTIYAVSIVVP